MNIWTPPLRDTPATGAIDDRIIAVMRLVLAASGLLVIYLVRSEPSRFVAVTYTALSLYVAYSAVLYILALRRHATLLESFYKWAHWVDVGWYALLIALTKGTSSIFFFGFFFAILVASFRWGFASGLRVTIASVILFATVGFVTTPPELQFELDRFLIRPIYLLAFGYMMAYWGGFEIQHKRRLALLKEVTTLSNPRFGVDRTIGSLMERLRTFYDANICLVVWVDPETGEHSLRYTDGRDPATAVHAEPIAIELAQQFLMLPPAYAVVYSTRLFRWWRLDASCHAFDVTTGEHMVEGQEACEALAATLDAEAFVSVPVQYYNETLGRLYLTSRQQTFDRSDADFLLQLIEHVMPVIENIRLVDRLASDAAEEERQRIARDLHDSVIQPYIGLRIGLTAIDQKLAAGTDVSRDIKRLLARIDDEITDLRGHMRGLRGTGAHGGNLVPAVRRFAAKFAAATHLDVQVEAVPDLRINDRLAAEVFQMVSEGLSNIRRHTQATQATVVLTGRNNHLVLKIENDVANDQMPANFTPRSITERAAALGGHTHIEQREDGGTAVIVEIPL